MTSPLRSVVRRRAWLAALGAALVVLAGAPAHASSVTAQHTQLFQPVDSSSYAATHTPSVLPGLLVWMAALAAFLVVGLCIRWYQRTHS